MADKTPIKLQPNVPRQVTFSYSNVTRNVSRSGDGSVYFTFQCEEGRLNCNSILLEQIKECWPGKMGTAQIEKLNAQRFEVTPGAIGESYPLEMQQWDDDQKSFVKIEWNGSDSSLPQPPEDVAPPVPPPSVAVESPNATKTTQDTPKATNAKISDIEAVMGYCLAASERIVPEGWTSEDKRAVGISMCIEAMKRGVTGADLAVVEPLLKEAPQDDGPPITAYEPPPEEEDQDLPF